MMEPRGLASPDKIPLVALDDVARSKKETQFAIALPKVVVDEMIKPSKLMDNRPSTINIKN